ncbi:MAG: DUF3048 domain-containing protein [Bifidobacteriaceae bacterium]|jgi:hypothetical protein|nr:DUF3048 domain-containing protein [Bifidobacteriaceae bacterium]
MRPGVRAKTAASAVLLVIAAGLVPACGTEPPQTPRATETAIRVEVKDAPPEVPPTWPLTGEVGNLEERAALAVKVENDPAARPQTGLEQADVIWEEMVEGGGSRFIAVFNSIVPESVGPVRSIRPMDGPILGAVGGLIACSGGQARFINQAKSAGLQVFTEDYAGYFRAPDRSMPHNLYLRPAEIWQQADQSHKALPRAEFSYAASDSAATAVLAGVDMKSIAVTISPVARPAWTWDAESGLLVRSEGSTPSKAASGGRLAASNVVVLAVAVQNAGGTDAAGSPIPETLIVGSGTGVVLTGGRAVDVTWSKASVSSPVELVTADGTAVQLAVGQTWVELVPESSGSWSIS